LKTTVWSDANSQEVATRKSTKRFCSAITLAILFLAARTARADDFWVKKDWTKWSKEECAKMLQDSPWTKQWSKGSVNVSASMPGKSNPLTAGEAAGAENAPELHYYVQLRSSLPVRQAMVRLQQIQGYTKMTDDQKKEFDAKAAAFFGNSYDEVILVHVEYGSNVQPYERDMANYWKNIREDSVPVDFYLINERGDRVSPVRFASPKNGSYTFDLIFPRLKNNEPIVREGDKALNIQFVNPAVGQQATTSGNPVTSTNAPSDAFGRERVLIQFKLDKMIINGKLSY
jgi:hypothetical protein